MQTNLRLFKPNIIWFNINDACYKLLNRLLIHHLFMFSIHFEFLEQGHEVLFVFFFSPHCSVLLPLLLCMHIIVAIKPLSFDTCPSPWHLLVFPLLLFSLFVWDLLSSWNISPIVDKIKGTTLFKILLFHRILWLWHYILMLNHVYKATDFFFPNDSFWTHKFKVFKVGAVLALHWHLCYLLSSAACMGIE